MNTSPYEKGLFLSHILKKSREHILTHPDIYPVEYSQSEIAKGEFNRVNLTKRQQKQYRAMAARRLKNEPLAYILGHKEFYDLDFKVTPATLIPRPETEHLVEEVIKLKPKNSTLIDIGTGSGNIIISIAYNMKHITYNRINFYGIDISSKALKIAKYNAKRHKLDKKIKFIKSDLLDHFIKHQPLNIKRLIIIANLPYLSEKIYNSAMPDVKNYEPKTALLGGKDGLDYYEKLFKQIKTLKKNCYMFYVTCYMEISPEQKTKMEKIIKKYFPGSKPEFSKDLAGKWRIAGFSI
jgi:release factor glutamine methyltransferase